VTLMWEVRASGYKRFYTDRALAERYKEAVVKKLSKQYGPGTYEVVIEGPHVLDVELVE
jgi:hypothetical protein